MHRKLQRSVTLTLRSRRMRPYESTSEAVSDIGDDRRAFAAVNHESQSDPFDSPDLQIKRRMRVFLTAHFRAGGALVAGGTTLTLPSALTSTFKS